MSVPANVENLVKRFADNISDYKRGKYNETQVRREFIDPLFEAIGWDVNNTKGYAEAYKEVVHEDAIKVGRATKAPDYSFRIGGTRKFFLEAKKPSVDIKHDTHPAYQLRRYAWSAKLPLSILTDFEEFAVYDCGIQPTKTDKAAAARIMYLTYDQYLDRWQELVDVFSPEAIRKGSFDKYAQTNKQKRGTAEVDAAFLAEIERWRESLARNIALRNALSQRELNFAVQMTIDRLIFLRIAEDRGIEPYGQLQGLLKMGNVYPQLLTIFQQADDRYNSGLFHFKAEKGRDDPDLVTPKLAIDDKVFQDIFKNLYYPDSPYEFSVLSADILGQVYEQFLGKVIRLTGGGRAKVEEKPEVRKAGGVYYTPTYIVDYIVKNTVGQLVEGKSPKQIGGKTPLRVLDPACGSGSFLLGAYQFLLDWHLNWYIANDPDQWASRRNAPIYNAPAIDPTAPNWKLTSAERKRILTDHIFGVDIDPQAVEVTKLSLLLKVLEGEDQQSLARQLTFAGFGERVLPDLNHNIKCGNSLIGPDYYASNPTQLGLLGDEEEFYRVNAFDWQAEFKEIMQTGGFDAVIGNPPYGMVANEESKNYFENSFETTEGRFDAFELFIEKGLHLAKENHPLGFIVPSPLLSNLYARKLRTYLLKNCSIQEITNFGMDVFTDPTIHTCIVIIAPGKQKQNVVKVRMQVNSIQELGLPYSYEIAQNELGNSENTTFDVFIDPNTKKIVDKINSLGIPIGEVYHIRQCIKTGNDKIYVKSSDVQLTDPWKPTLQGRSIERYSTRDRNLYLKYGPWLARNWKNKTFYETPKIVVRETGRRITATLDLEFRYVLSSLYALYPIADETPELRYILGILNSNLATFFMSVIALQLTKGAFTKIRTNQLARLPIRTINFNNPADKARHDQIVALVETMLALHQQQAAATLPQQKTMLKRQIEATDQQIDKLVYELYGLLPEEIAIVEGKGQ